jgi:hypothetical protein
MTIDNQGGVQNSQTNIQHQNINSQPSIPVAAVQNNNIANFKHKRMTISNQGGV